MSDGLHDGHRNRVKEEFLAHGFDESTPAHKVLELLLFYCVSRSDTNPLAHQLIEKYGNISGVLDAPVDELVQFKGLTRSNVGLLKMIMPIARIYRGEKQENRKCFYNSDDMYNYIMEKFSGLTTEKFGMLFLDGAGHNLGFEFLSSGSISAVGISSREIIKYTLDRRATAVVLVHNHPSGIALPSVADAENTETVMKALSHIDVHLLDHIIVVEGDYVSMRQSQEYSYIFR